jgi:hypothetical protein
MDLFSSIELFSELPVIACGTLLQLAQHERHVAGSQIVSSGDRANKFYIIVSGFAEVLLNQMPDEDEGKDEIPEEPTIRVRDSCAPLLFPVSCSATTSPAPCVACARVRSARCFGARV